MRPSVFSLFLLACIFTTACSQQEKAGDINGAVRALCKASSLNDWKRLYTKETVRVIDGALRSGVIEKGSEIHYLLPMGDGVEYMSDYLMKKNDEARLRLTVVRHPRENMRGASLDVPVVLEDGVWRFNLAAEIRNGLKNRGNR